MVSDKNVMSLIQRELPICKGGDESKFLFLRRKILVTEVKSYLEIKLQEIRKYYSDWEYIEIRNKARPCSSIHNHSSEIYHKQGSRNYQEEYRKSLIIKFNFSKKVYWDKKGIWGKGYFVSTVGINEEVIRKYVEAQEKEETDKLNLNFERTTPVKVWKSM